MTGATALQDSFVYDSLGIYNISAVLYVRGFYLFNIYLNNTVTNQFELIMNCPFNLTLDPNQPSANYSVVSGSGLTRDLIGRVEDIYLEVIDIYGNPYNQSMFRNMSVYNISVVCNQTDIIPVNLTDSNTFCKIHS